ncbi:hydrocarbon-binding protein [Oculatella sp. LEGE 06141]|uniref:hydrocarbon-binding protein n=1 Tax=Oculatella sp. LEGE 06141 TaxID=1828648 RepID=UPI00188240B9|nr:hydrocarbon-binding protein [Oculatella sp. LEGE 06141]MBE9183108.1 hydrocarbon-binding protein [Oculatella sp. LEGE 06141]
MSALRPKLDDYGSIICTKAIILGMEDALGAKATAIALTAAGRKRGKELVQSLGLSKTSASLEEVTAKLQAALGEQGTRLCLINKIEQTDDGFTVYVTEDICTSGEPQGSDRKCLFTLGAVWGALEELVGKRFQGKHTDSVLKGSPYNVFEFKPLT